ncbi:MAG: rRNA (cytosine1402-N4)-methyltransferase [Acidimicrobiaceae bacterium]|nr:rRNA (cytosine1402-N4)-methyltransferase [Acidimicrobiaceae bacterium]
MSRPPTDEVEDPYSARFHRCRSGRHPDGVLSVGGLLMSQATPAFAHTPVMLDEVVELFGAVPPGTLFDATVGGAGHAHAILDARPDIDLVGIDRDADALEAARDRLARYGERATLHHARFDALSTVIESRPPAASRPVVGVLFDLGVSSPQFDRPERGFSYRADAPLDMRMDRSTGRTAADVVNTYGEAELARLFAQSGERRFARRIARALVAARPMRTTDELVEVVRGAIPHAARRTGGHPAKRVFQALRIEVNEELDVLGPALDAALEAVVPGGRVVVLSYHSGEDRLVKQRFVDAATGGCVCPPGLPCSCGATPTVRLLNRGARKPSAAEVAANPRAESARLRAVEKLTPVDAAAAL